MKPGQQTEIAEGVSIRHCSKPKALLNESKTCFEVASGLGSVITKYNV